MIIIKNGNVFLDGKIQKCDVSFSQTITGIGEFDGEDYMDAEEDSFDKALHFHAENGTTSLLATSVTAPVEDLEKMLADMMKEELNGVRVIGAHVEGPYISLKNKGAQHERHALFKDR